MVFLTNGSVRIDSSSTIEFRVILKGMILLNRFGTSKGIIGLTHMCCKIEIQGAYNRELD